MRRSQDRDRERERERVRRLLLYHDLDSDADFFGNDAAFYRNSPGEPSYVTNYGYPHTKN